MVQVATPPEREVVEEEHEVVPPVPLTLQMTDPVGVAPAPVRVAV
jgi:hypothetical protein